MPGRNDSQCKFKFNQEKNSRNHKISWTLNEDKVLFKLILENGKRNWNCIANKFNIELKSQRNGKQCRERWVNFLNP